MSAVCLIVYSRILGSIVCLLKNNMITKYKSRSTSSSRQSPRPAGRVKRKQATTNTRQNKTRAFSGREGGRDFTIPGKQAGRAPGRAHAPVSANRPAGRNNKLRVMALGGLEEVGRNMTLIE